MPENERNNTDRAKHSRERIGYWNSVANNLDRRRAWGLYYHKRINEIYRFVVAPGLRVLEVGCAEGDLLAALSPSGIGVDFADEMLKRAKRSHPQLRFIECDAHDIARLNEKFDVIVLSDLVSDLWDVQAVFEQLGCLSTSDTRLILNFYSRLWELPLKLVRLLGLGRPLIDQNWLTLGDMTNLLSLADFEVIRHWEEIICPLPIPLLGSFLNRFLVKIWPFKYLAMTNFVIARPRRDEPWANEPYVSIIIPARNEAGNIPAIFDRMPNLGRSQELIFVEGHSDDNTYEAIENEIRAHPQFPCKLVKQTGKGKGDAMRLGFSHAGGDILMILDSDLSVSPEDLPRFYETLISNKADFVNGVRLVYPMEARAMRFLNLLGNKTFGWAFSWLMGQHIRDTLCGTKALWKKDYDLIVSNRSYFGDFDPFGDFDLLFGATKLNLKIVDMPVRYHERTYGTIKIRRWRHGWLLLKMAFFAAWRLKFR
jgi:hypothetical protein